MKTSIFIVVALILTAASIAYIQRNHSKPVIQQQAQPQRERYVPPEWVVNERGQRCIKQGDVITCG